jgi:hypothetical protein
MENIEKQMKKLSAVIIFIALVLIIAVMFLIILVL